MKECGRRRASSKKTHLHGRVYGQHCSPHSGVPGPVRPGPVDVRGSVARPRIFPPPLAALGAPRRCGGSIHFVAELPIPEELRRRVLNVVFEALGEESAKRTR